MSIVIPIAGLLLALFAALGSRSGSPESGNPRNTVNADLLAALGVMVIGSLVVSRFAPDLDKPWLITGLLIGVLAAVLGTRASWNIGSAAAWGISMAMLCEALPDTGRPAAQLGVIVGAGILGGLIGSPAAAMGAISVVLIDHLGKLAGESEVLPFAGGMLGLAAILAITVSLFLRDKKMLQMLAAVTIPAILGYADGAFWLKNPEFGLILALGAVVGFVIHLLIPPESSESSGFVGLGVLMAVGLATVAFSLGSGTGMAMAFFSAFAVLASLGNMRALLVLGPLLAIAMFRDFRTMYSELARAFDIGQHYAILGIVMGMLVPLMFVDWLPKMKATGVTYGIALTLWAIPFILFPSLLTVFLGTFGIAGFVIGAGLSGPVEALRRGSSGSAMALAAGMSGTALVSYKWLSDSLDMARDEKIKILIYSGVALVAISAAIFAMTRTQKEGAANVA